MPYERTNSKSEDFLTKALSNEEIQDGARRAQLEDAYLEREFRDIGLEEKSPKTWGVATKEIEAYDWTLPTGTLPRMRLQRPCKGVGNTKLDLSESSMRIMGEKEEP